LYIIQKNDWDKFVILVTVIGEGLQSHVRVIR